MGQEVACTAKVNGKKLQGICHARNRFRPVPRRHASQNRVRRDEVRGSWQASELTIRSSEGSLALQLGARAAKWEQKIVDPPTRLDKLGVKPGMRVRMTGTRHADLQNEVEHAGAAISRASADIVFFGAERRSELARVTKLTSAIPPDGTIWIVYPKGVREITESDVIAAIRAAGLKDVKVASFSPTHTALKAVIPLAQRVR